MTMTKLMTKPTTNKRVSWTAVLGGCLAALGCGVEENDNADTLTTTAAALTAASSTTTKFFVPPPNPGAVKQVASLLQTHDFKNAARLTALAATPRAVWLTGGSPRDVEKSVRQTMEAAACEHRVPILVAYNLPYRDCAQYSAGGARDTAAYQAWIGGVARGIGTGRAIVILEPDGLGLIPHNTTIYGVPEWCKPTLSDANGKQVPAPGASPDERYAQLQYAGGALAKVAPNAAVYFDSTHSAWLGVEKRRTD